MTLLRNLAHGILMALGFVILFVGSYFAATAIQEWWASYQTNSTDLLRASGVITASLILGIGSQIRDVPNDEGRVIPWRLW